MAFDPVEADGGRTDRRQSRKRSLAEDVLVEEVSIDGMCGVY